MGIKQQTTASHVPGRGKFVDKEKTDAEQVQAAATVQQSQSSSSKSTEQRLQELDNPAAKGYIMQDEYKAKRKAILDGM